MVSQAKAEDTALFLMACHISWVKDKDESALHVLMSAAHSPELVTHSVAEWATQRFAPAGNFFS